jgi:hypothetical protein
MAEDRIGVETTRFILCNINDKMRQAQKVT